VDSRFAICEVGDKGKRQNHVKWGLVEVMALLVRLYRFFTDLTARRRALDPRMGVIWRYQV